MVGLDDYIFDISITANRPDCQSVLGIAREVAAILGKPLHMPAMDYNTVCDADEPISVKVEAPDLCPRYGTLRSQYPDERVSPLDEAPSGSVRPALHQQCGRYYQPHLLEMG